MKTEDIIIESFNRCIEQDRKTSNIDTTGHLVLQKTTKPHAVFKAYKEYNYIVWFVKGSSKYRVITVSLVDRVVGNSDTTILDKLNIELSNQILRVAISTQYKNLVYGTYGTQSEV